MKFDELKFGEVKGQHPAEGSGRVV